MKESKTFVIGDIHGGYKALQQCLSISEFDYSEDTLICLGDVCDGWSQTDKCLDELLKIKNLIYILGNHDWWALQWAKTGEQDHAWLKHGGLATINAYPEGIPDHHLQLLSSAQNYHIENGNKLFVHGGILLDRDIKEQNQEIFLWDRSLFRKALDQFMTGINENITPYEEIYIGHSPTHQYGIKHPVQYGGVWLMDTGAGWSGPLSMMNIHTKEYFTSAPLIQLYPDEVGRLRN